MTNGQKDYIRHMAFKVLPSVIRAKQNKSSPVSVVAESFDIALEFFYQEKLIEERDDRRTATCQRISRLTDTI